MTLQLFKQKPYLLHLFIVEGSMCALWHICEVKGHLVSNMFSLPVGPTLLTEPSPGPWTYALDN